MLQDEEIWAEVKDFPLYAISNFGRVMNLESHRILSPRENSYGYGRVALRKDGRTYERYVHRLVAEAFVTGYRRYVKVTRALPERGNHIDNLRFKKGVRMGRAITNPRAPRMRKVLIVEMGKVFTSVERAAEYIDGDPSMVYSVLRGDRPRHKGYTFKYHYEELQ